MSSQHHDQLLTDLTQLAAWLCQHAQRHPDRIQGDQAFIITIGRAMGRVEAFEQFVRAKQSDGLSRQLVALGDKLGNMEKHIMSGVDDIETLITELNEATNVEADRFQKLLDQLKDGATPTQLAKIKTEMRTGIDRLKAIGADPEQPIPPADGGGTDTNAGAGGGV